MKRLVWGAVLFLCMTATNGSRLLACNERRISHFRTSVFEAGDNTVLITDDDEFVTVITYSNAEVHADWM